MQKRLSELALIPDKIQESLMMVAKTMQKFLPPGSLIVTDPHESLMVEEIDQYDDSYRFDEKLEEGPATDDELDGKELDQGEEEEEKGATGSSEQDFEENAVEEGLDDQEVEQEPEKVISLEKKWPWTAANDRNAFKKSNFQGYRSSSLIQNR